MTVPVSAEELQRARDELASAEADLLTAKAELAPVETRRRCTATNREGDRCGRTPIPGGTVCVLHGGRAPQAQQAAKMRLFAMVEPILGVFEEVVEQWRGVRCAACGRPTGDPGPVIKVGQLVLDRAGFGPKATLEMEQPTEPITVVRRIIVYPQPEEPASLEADIDLDAEAEPKA